MSDTLRYLRTGGDPRLLPDYGALRDELAKLTHPARPDINWRYAEKRCLSLFEQNGVELQTAAWYTLARTHLAGVFGLNEGLAILEALLTHQWNAFWPSSIPTRMDIFSQLSERLAQALRAQAISYAELSPLYTAEQHLSRLGDVLQRQGLRHVSKLDDLRRRLHIAAETLENSDAGESVDTGSLPMLPASAGMSTLPMHKRPSHDIALPPGSARWVYLARHEQGPKVDVLIDLVPPSRPWRAFFTGAAVSLAISCLALWAYGFCSLNPARDSLMASVAPAAAPLSDDALNALVIQAPAWLTDRAEYDQLLQARLAELAALPPDWPAGFAAGLLRQTQALWPDSVKTLSQSTAWRQQLEAKALPSAHQANWHLGIAQLELLAERLNALDVKRGKYLTVSELKTSVFSAIQLLNQHPPLEERLRRLENAPSTLKQDEARQHLSELLNRYALIRHFTEQP